MSWLRDLVALPEDATTTEVAERWTSAGLNVERIDQIGSEVTGPVVVGRVLSFNPEPQKNGKTIRYCRVDVGAEHNDPATEEYPASRGIVCGADNFEVGDLVVTSLPGSVLAGGFAISARKTYGHISDGMICAEDELGLGEDHAGIIVLPSEVDGRPVNPGDDAMALLVTPDEVLEADITPDTGYCLSLRGLARETAQAFGVAFTDPYAEPRPEPTTGGHPVRLDATDGCDLFVALTIEGLDPQAPVPGWMAARLQAAGMRSISLPVDVTNYVMLESGQPLHAYDADKLQGPIVVRWAREGERLVTLDDQDRALTPADLLITDDSGPIGLAGVMGGLTTEVTETTSTIVLEAAHFDAVTIGRGHRRHKLPSEASKRFERGVDPALPLAAALRAAHLMCQFGGGRLVPERTVVGDVPALAPVRLAADLPSRILGLEIETARVVDILTTSGCQVEAEGDQLTVVPPGWRPDLVDPHDVVEEVGRKVGFEAIESILPTAPAGRGLTAAQRARREVHRAVVDAGFVELISLPFISVDEIDQLGIAPDDERRRLVRLANPLDDTHPFLRSSLLPGLFTAVRRNTSRSQDDLALFEIGSVFRGGELPAAPMPSVEQRPSDAELAAIEAALPQQPRMLAAVVCGDWVPATWQSPAVPATWVHVVAMAEAAAHAVGADLIRRNADLAPFHPGRCAALEVAGEVIGHAGELHPSVVKACGLPARTCAVELDLDRLVAAAGAPGTIEPLSGFPLAKEDVALVVGEEVAVAEVQQALVEGAGELLESISLFDIYRGDQIGEGKKSLAFSLRFRGVDKTLTDADAGAARDAAVAVAVERFGAVHRA